MPPLRGGYPRSLLCEMSLGLYTNCTHPRDTRVYGIASREPEALITALYSNGNTTFSHNLWEREYVPFIVMPVVGIALNALDIAVFRSSDMRSRSSSILCAVGLINLVTNVFDVVSSLIRITSHSFEDAAVFRVVGAISTFLVRAMIFLLCLLAFERTMKIRRPFWNHWKAKYYVMAAIPTLVCWKFNR